MSTEPKPWAVGDACPACSGDLKPVPLPSEAQRAAAANKDNPVPLPPTVDHADPAQIEELGNLHRCGCGYQSRVVPPARGDDDAAHAAHTGDGAAGVPAAPRPKRARARKPPAGSSGD
jgi:hypothetical protein